MRDCRCVELRALCDEVPRTPPGPEGSNGTGIASCAAEYPKFLSSAACRFICDMTLFRSTWSQSFFCSPRLQTRGFFGVSWKTLSSKEVSYNKGDGKSLGSNTMSYQVIARK